MPGQNRILEAYRQQQEALASAAIANRMRQDAQARMAELRAVQRQRLMEIRRPMQLEDKALMERFARMHPVENMKRSFSAGRALMTVSLMDTLRTLGRNIKGLFANLMGSLAKAVGMLTSPVGLAIGALAALAAGTYIAIKRIDDYNDRLQKNSDILGQKQDKALQPQMERVQQLELKYVGNVHFTSDKTTLISNNTTNGKGQGGAGNKWSKTTSSEVYAKDAVTDLYSRIYADRNLRNAYYAERGRFDGKMSGDTGKEIAAAGYSGGNVLLAQMVRNETSADQRARNAVYLEGAQSKEVVAAQEKIIKLRQQMLAGKLSQSRFRNQAMGIINATAHPNAKGLWNEYDYSAGELSKNAQYWKNSKGYQLGAYNTLIDEMNGSLGTMSGRLIAIKELKGRVANFSDQWWRGVAKIISSMTATYHIAGKKVDIAFRALPNGQIDFSDILFQIQKVAGKLKLDIRNFANFAADVYKQLADLGVIKGGGGFYKPARDFVYNQIRHSTVSADMAAQWWDAKIGRGNKNVRWKGLTREQYIKRVSQNRAGDGFGREREIIRHGMADAAADERVKELKAQKNRLKQLGSAGKNTINTNNLGGTSLGGGSHTGSGGRTGGGSGRGGGSGTGNNQKDYASTYGGGSSRPTQVIINIDKLANFDRTMISKDADDQKIIALVENKVSEAIMMIAAPALNAVGRRVSDESYLA